MLLLGSPWRHRLRRRPWSRHRTGPGLAQQDPELEAILAAEEGRQRDGLQLIASENYASAAVREAVSSCLMNKYSEGYPGERYYSGNAFVDQCEELCRDRALRCFGVDRAAWHVNVQALSGSVANFSVYTTLLRPHGRLMGLELSHGGHLTHGFRTRERCVSASAIYFESLPYQVDEAGWIDYNGLEDLARRFHPKLIVAGASAYARIIDFRRMRHICDRIGAYLLADISHIAGAVVAKLHPSPFDPAHAADAVMTTTQKTLRGPRGALIFVQRPLAKKLDQAVFPGLQGGPHNHTIAGISAALAEAATPEYVRYMEQVHLNARALAQALMARQICVVTQGTDNHIVLVDLRSHHINGAQLQAVAEMADVYTNKNTIPGDISSSAPSGLRLGTPAITSRGVGAGHMDAVADWIRRLVRITSEIRGHQEQHADKPVTMKAFQLGLGNLPDNLRDELACIKKEVNEMCRSLPLR